MQRCLCENRTKTTIILCAPGADRTTQTRIRLDTAENITQKTFLKENSADTEPLSPVFNSKNWRRLSHALTIRMSLLGLFCLFFHLKLVFYSKPYQSIDSYFVRLFRKWIQIKYKPKYTLIEYEIIERESLYECPIICLTIAWLVSASALQPLYCVVIACDSWIILIIVSVIFINIKA